MLWLLFRTRREQRAIRRMMRDFDPDYTGWLALAVLACGPVLWGLAVALTAL